LRDRYKILERHKIGEGSSASVYKGLDLDKQELRNVAVKLYKTAPGDSSGLEAFRQSVEVFQAISAERPNIGEVLRAETTPHKRSSLGSLPREEHRRAGSKDSADSAGIVRYKTDSYKTDCLLEKLDVRECFVRLLDYSKTESGEPGLDAQDEVLFLVFELGDESLEDMLLALSEEGKTLSADELRDLQWTLVSIVWGLHAAGYVHLDIKPKNVMSFDIDGRKQWKLIDLDGAVPSGSKQELKALTYTPEYMPPELAHACYSASLRTSSVGGRALPTPTLTMSRLMDVWSVGICALEAIFLQPPLRPFYKDWNEETGCDLKFYQWLGNYQSDPIVAEDMKEYIAGIHQDMANLLEGMLTKDPAQRFSIGQCVSHAWFEPKRQSLVRELNLDQPADGSENAIRGAKACALM